jgi:hypothetical protein
MLLRKLLPLSAVAFLTTLAASSQAQDKDKAAVEALFAEGKKLVADGKIALACPKFLASYELEQRLGTLLNLADCYERNGQLASAFARYVEAKPRAERANQQERAEYAAQHAAALEPRLARLTVEVPARVGGLEVKRDGVLVADNTYGAALPVDVGKHQLLATAPGKQSWTGEVAIARDGELKIIQIPTLSDKPSEAPPAPPLAVDATTNDTPPEVPARGGTSARKLAGPVLAGVGVLSLAVGAGFGFSALGKNSDSAAHCGQNGAGANDCTGEGYDLRTSAVADGNISTVLFVAGTAAIIGGLVLWLTAPSAKPSATAQLRPGLAF